MLSEAEALVELEPLPPWTSEGSVDGVTVASDVSTGVGVPCTRAKGPATRSRERTEVEMIDLMLGY